MKTITYREALDQGYTVDTYCVPWLAYKGARFAPDEKARVSDWEIQCDK